MADLILQNDFSGGTAAADITAANSGGTSGDAFTGVSVTASGQVPAKYATVGGERVMQIDNPGTNLEFVRWAHLDPKLKQVFVWTHSTKPGTELNLARVAHGTTAGTEVGMAAYSTLKASGKFGLAIAGATAAWLSSLVLTDGQEYRGEVYLEAGTDASTGKYRAMLFAGRFSPVLVDDSTLISGVNVASTSGGFAQSRYGKFGSDTYAGQLNYYRVKTLLGAYALSAPQPYAPITASMSPAGSPSSDVVGNARTLSVVGLTPNPNTNPIQLSVDWGDGGTVDTGTVLPGATKTFTRIPSAAGPSGSSYVKNAVVSYNQPY